MEIDFSSIKETEYIEIMPLGSGGYGKIKLVEHPMFHYRRALKLINVGDITEEEKKETWKRFSKECEALFKVNNGAHPNIVKIYQITKYNQRPAVELEFIIGQTLQQYIFKTKFIEYSEIVKFVDHIVNALAYCHVDIYKFNVDRNDKHVKIDGSNGVVVNAEDEYEEEYIKRHSFIHNDLYPKNIMRRDIDGAYILIDFGLAWQNNNPVNSKAGRGPDNYLAPEYREQNKKFWEAIDNKLEEVPKMKPEKNWDVYSLGCLLFEMLTGVAPKDDMSQIDETSIINLRGKSFETVHKGQTYILDYPKEFNGIILKCINSDPKERYKNAKELYNALSEAIKRYDPKKELDNQIGDLEKQLETQKFEARQNENRLKQELDAEIQSRLNLKDSFEEQIASIKADALANEYKTKQELDKLKSSSAGLTEYYEDQIRRKSSEAASKENKLREEIQSKNSIIESLKVQINTQESKSQEREENLKQDLKDQNNINSSLKQKIEELNKRINSLKSQISKSGIKTSKTISKTFIFIALIFGIITFAIGLFAEDMGIIPNNIKSILLNQSDSPIKNGEIVQSSTEVDTITIYVNKTDTIYVGVPHVVEVPKKEIEYRSSPTDTEKINQLERENRALKAKNKDLQNEIKRWEEIK